MTDPNKRINNELRSTGRMVRKNQEAIKYKGGVIIAWFMMTMTLILVGMPVLLVVVGPLFAAGFMYVVLVQGVSPDEIPKQMFDFER